MTSDREPRTVRVDPDVFSHLEEKAAESGLSKGEALERAIREWTDRDRLTRLEDKVDTLREEAEATFSEIELERERQTRPSGQLTPTEERAHRIASDLPAHTAISETMVDAAIEEHAGGSYKTLKKYKRTLKRMGRLIPSPTSDEFFTSPRQFALTLEHEDDISDEMLDDLIGEYEEHLGEGWYLDALPDDYVQNQDLRVEEADLLDVEAYRRRNDLYDRGVQ